MAEIYVQSSSALQGVINELKTLNGEFRSKATDLESEQSTLVTKWEGDASETFADTFRREYPNFEAFATAIDEYVAGLSEILANYETAEAKNISIASE